MIEDVDPAGTSLLLQQFRNQRIVYIFYLHSLIHQTRSLAILAIWHVHEASVQNQDSILSGH